MSNVCQSAPICCASSIFDTFSPFSTFNRLEATSCLRSSTRSRSFEVTSPALTESATWRCISASCPLHGFDGRKVVPERYHLPEVGVGAFAHLGCGLLQLQLRDLFAQPGEFVAADDLQPCEQGLHGRDGTQDAAFYQRQGQRPHLGDREIGLHQPVLGLEYAARGRDLREIGGECLAARLQGGVEAEAAVFERAVMLLGRGAATRRA